MKTLISFLTVLAVLQTSYAQFDYDRYKPSSLRGIYAERKYLIDSKVDLNISTIDFPYTCSVQYGDSLRSIEPNTKEVIAHWLKSVAQVKYSDTLFLSEALFYEDSRPYWIPVQNPVLRFLTEEVARADTLDIFVTVIGASKTQLVLTLNEFQK